MSASNGFYETHPSVASPASRWRRRIADSSVFGFGVPAVADCLPAGYPSPGFARKMPAWRREKLDATVEVAYASESSRRKLVPANRRRSNAALNLTRTGSEHRL